MVVKTKKKIVKGVLNEQEKAEAKRFLDELKKDLAEAGTIYVVGLKTDRNGVWKRFSLYYIKNGSLMKITFPEYVTRHYKIPLWKPLKYVEGKGWTGGYFENNVYGMDRAWEIVYRLSNFLFNDGYKLKSEFISQ